MFGRQRLAEGEKQIARQALETVVRKEPNHAQAFALLASLSYQDGSDFQAEAYLDRAIEIMRSIVARRKHDMPTRASLANFLMARGHTEEAEEILSAVDLAVFPIRATQEEFDDRIADARARGLPSVLINTVPKSASETIWNRLAEGLQLSQGHISLCLYPDCTVVPAGRSLRLLAVSSRRNIFRRANITWRHFAMLGSTELCSTCAIRGR